jgi:hypothetical protein
MKATEFTQPSDKKLMESLSHNNTTGVLAEDLVKVVRTHHANQWSKPMTLEESLEFDRMIVSGRFSK